MCGGGGGEGEIFFFGGDGMVLKGDPGEISRHQQNLKNGLQKSDCQLTANEGWVGGIIKILQSLMGGTRNFILTPPEFSNPRPQVINNYRSLKNCLYPGQDIANQKTGSKLAAVKTLHGRWCYCLVIEIQALQSR